MLPEDVSSCGSFRDLERALFSCTGRIPGASKALLIAGLDALLGARCGAMLYPLPDPCFPKDNSATGT